MPEVRLNVADVIFSIDFEDQRAAELVQEFYAGFLTDDPVSCVLKSTWLGSHDLHFEFPVEYIPPEVNRQGRIICLNWDMFEGMYNLDTNQGACSVRGIFGLERFLWALVSILLPERDGILLHAASVLRNGHGYVFPAPSGTGKSTLVRNSPECRVLSDDGTLLRFRNGQLFAYGSPFRSDNYEDFRNTRHAVAGIYFLVQSPDDRIAPMSVAQALEHLMPQIFLFGAEPSWRRRCFQVAERAVLATETGLLYLTNSRDFWRCIPDVVARETGIRISQTGH